MSRHFHRLHDLIEDDLTSSGIHAALNGVAPKRMSGRRCLAKLGCAQTEFQEVVAALYFLYLPGSKRKPTYRRLYREIREASLRERSRIRGTGSACETFGQTPA